MNGPILNAADDPLFCTFAKRLLWFKRKGETDEQLAERLGIPCSRLRGWRYRKHEPSMGAVAHLADVLNVDLGWLGSGRNHYLAFHQGVKVRLIPREPIVLYQLVGSDGKPEGPVFEEGAMLKQRQGS
jgi:transcriptional regulator with XRE-family HTH domain